MKLESDKHVVCEGNCITVAVNPQACALMKQICFISVLFQFYFTCKSRFSRIRRQIFVCQKKVWLLSVLCMTITGLLLHELWTCDVDCGRNLLLCRTDSGPYVLCSLYKLKSNQIYLRQKKEHNATQKKQSNKYVDRTQRQYETAVWNCTNECPTK